MKISEQLGEMQLLLNDAISENQKFEQKDNKAASVRVRGLLMDIIHKSKDIRSQITDLKKK